VKEVNSLSTFDGKLQSHLGQFARETIGSLATDPACGLALRAMIIAGAERMETQGCVANRDLTIARSNLKRFINEMKVEAVFLGHPEWLDYDSFHAAERKIEQLRHSSLNPLTFWPFWPEEFDASVRGPN
jgi:hypothetical protein